jgi:hypothetical protein
MHRRIKPRTHRFRYRGFWLLLDLDELAQTGFGLTVFSRNRFNLFSYHDCDHGDKSDTPLRKQIERNLSEAGIGFTNGSIRLLCMPRTLGYSFNPLSIYFCAHADGTPAAVVYEVHNTYGERHSYTIPAKIGTSIHQSCNKAFYVSPFLDMDLRYNFSVSEPSDKLAVAIRASKCGETVMVATLAGERRPLTDAMLLRLFFAMPAITLKVIAAIHWEAVRLWLKGLHFRPRTSESIGIPAPLPTSNRKNV